MDDFRNDPFPAGQKCAVVWCPGGFDETLIKFGDVVTMATQYEYIQRCTKCGTLHGIPDWMDGWCVQAMEEIPPIMHEGKQCQRVFPVRWLVPIDRDPATDEQLSAEQLARIRARFIEALDTTN